MNEPLRSSKNLKYYQLSVHRSGKYLYASTQPTVTDKAGKRSSRHIHWGTLDERMRFYPNKKYLTATDEERRHLIFPDDWDLSLLDDMNITDASEQDLRYEKRIREASGNLMHRRDRNVGADQIYRLIRSLRGSKLPADAILDAVLSMEEKEQ